MQNIIKLPTSPKEWQILSFKIILLAWIMSLPFKNTVYQISFVLIDLFFLAHILFTKNFGIIKEILIQIKYLALAFAGLYASMLVANLLNAQYLSPKSWEYTGLFIFRFGMVFLALAYFYRLEYFSKNEINRFLLVCFVFLAIVSIFYIIKDPRIIVDINQGVKASLNSRTGYGLFAGLGLVFVFTYGSKFWTNILAVLFAFFVIFSFARSSWVASAVAIIVFISLNYKNLSTKQILLLIVLAFFINGLYFSFDSFQERFAKLLKGDSTHRLYLWKYSLDMISQSPIFGYGIDTFRNLPNSPVLKSPGWNATHNMVLESLLYTGIAGVVCYFAMIFQSFHKAFKSKNYKIFAIFTYIFVISQFDFGAYMSKELLSFIVIFTFLAYADDFKGTPCKS